MKAEAAKGADLWSIFTLMGFTGEEAYEVYQAAAEQDNAFTFPVTLKDKTEVFTMIFRFAILSAHHCFFSCKAIKAACTHAISAEYACSQYCT